MRMGKRHTLILRIFFIERVNLVSLEILFSPPSACGGDLQGPTGTFTSPNYPNPNPHGRICEWRITVQEGKQVTLIFNNLRLEAHPSCNSEQVTVSVLRSQGHYIPLAKEFIVS